MSSLRPVYLHSTWRTGSTYLWAKFRARPETCCYFEPLNEHLVDATPAFIDAFEPWPYANHPALSAPYLDEFRPLLAADGGLEGFPAQLSYRRFCLADTAECPELEAYFDRLAAHARRQGRTPVFGCVRTGLRVGWFAHHLPGTHIVIRRDPRCQFVSCLNQATSGNQYFMERGCIIAGCNRDDPALAPLQSLVPLPPPSEPTLSLEDVYRRHAGTMDWSAHYAISYYLDRLARRRSDAADLIVDMDAISDDCEVRADAEREIERATGMALSLHDCRIERYRRHLAWAAPAFAAIEARVDALMARDDMGQPDAAGGA